MVEIQVGARNNPNQDRIKYDGTSVVATLEALGITAESVSSKESAQLALQRLDDALVNVNGVRANLGAIQNRLQSVIETLGITEENPVPIPSAPFKSISGNLGKSPTGSMTFSS